MEQIHVVKLSSALSNQPFFVRVDNPNDITIDSVISQAIQSLDNVGKPLESTQLEQLYHSHQLFNQSRSVQKGDFLKTLNSIPQTIGDQKVIVYELDLIASHSGGIDVELELIEQWRDAESDLTDSYCLLCKINKQLNYNEMEEIIETYFPEYKFNGFNSINSIHHDNRIIFYVVKKETAKLYVKNSIDEYIKKRIKKIKEKYDECDYDIREYVDQRLDETKIYLQNNTMERYLKNHD